MPRPLPIGSRREPWLPLKPAEPEPERITCYGDVRRAMLPKGWPDHEAKHSFTDLWENALTEPYSVRKMRLAAEREAAQQRTAPEAADMTPEEWRSPRGCKRRSGDANISSPTNFAKKEKNHGRKNYISSTLKRRSKFKNGVPRDRAAYMARYHQQRRADQEGY